MRCSNALGCPGSSFPSPGITKGSRRQTSQERALQQYCGPGTIPPKTERRNEAGPVSAVGHPSPCPWSNLWQRLASWLAYLFTFFSDTQADCSHQPPPHCSMAMGQRSGQWNVSERELAGPQLGLDHKLNLPLSLSHPAAGRRGHPSSQQGHRSRMERT